MMPMLPPEVSDRRDPAPRRFTRADPDGFFTDGQSLRPDPLGRLLVSLAPIDRIRGFVTRIPPIGSWPRRRDTSTTADPTVMAPDGRTARAEAANS